jgi:phenylpyruvate tautomerase PptA (4-oxalocrotonate tautomerase family)
MSGIVTWEEVMPLVQVDLPRALFEEKGTQIGDEVHQALIDALEVPADDRFQIFRPREAGELVFDPRYGGVDRRSLIVIQVLMVRRYTVELKRELYRRIVTRLAGIGIRPEDIQIAVTENYYEDWYAGRLHDA